MGVHFRLLDSVHNPEFRKSKGLPDIIVEGVKPTTDVDPNHRKHIGAGLNCADCHLGIAHAGALHNKTKMATCFACHDKRRSSGMPANENCTGCHRKLDKVVPSAPIVFGAGEASVKFKHAPHVAAFKCTDCHTKLFQMAKGKAKIAYSDHATDKLCFSCHNGKIAFDTATCTKCHAKSPVPEAPIVFGSGDKAVKFSHKPHIAAFQCSECHENLFKMAKGSTKIVFTDHKSGKACFSCHSGKKAFGIDKCTKCHAKSPAPKKLVFKAKEMSSVTFNHEAHNAMFACNDCHTKIFNYKHPSPPVSMDDMGKGKACGACHNGKTAFATDGDCEKCHAK
jgi:c(7)-type cytochrome triheme protein